MDPLKSRHSIDVIYPKQQHQKMTENNHHKHEGTTSDSTSSSSPKPIKGRSCKGTLYYSSTLKSNARNPLCVGLSQSLILSREPCHRDGCKANVSRESWNQKDFRYGCVGYSIYKDCKNQPNGTSDSQTNLPLCLGIEALVDRGVNNTAASAAVIHNKEDDQGASARPQKPTPSYGDEFLAKFTRNANVVAMGVVKNLHKVGNRIKDSVDNFLYPYKRPPK